MESVVLSVHGLSFSAFLHLMICTCACLLSFVCHFVCLSVFSLVCVFQLGELSNANEYTLLSTNSIFGIRTIFISME